MAMYKPTQDPFGFNSIDRFPRKRIKNNADRAAFFEIGGRDDADAFRKADATANFANQLFQFLPPSLTKYLQGQHDTSADKGNKAGYESYQKAWWDTNDTTNPFNVHNYGSGYGGTYSGMGHSLSDTTNPDSYTLGGGKAGFYANMTPLSGVGETAEETWSMYKNAQRGPVSDRSYSILRYAPDAGFWRNMNDALRELATEGRRMKDGHYGYQNVQGDGGDTGDQHLFHNALPENGQNYGDRVDAKDVQFSGAGETNLIKDRVFSASKITTRVQEDNRSLAEELDSGEYRENPTIYELILSGAYIKWLRDHGVSHDTTGKMDLSGMNSTNLLNIAKKFYFMNAGIQESVNRYQLAFNNMVGPASWAPDVSGGFFNRDQNTKDTQDVQIYFDANRDYYDNYWAKTKANVLDKLNPKNTNFLNIFPQLDHNLDVFAPRMFSVMNPDNFNLAHGGSMHQSTEVDDKEYHDYVSKSVLFSSIYLGNQIQNGAGLHQTLSALGASPGSFLQASVNDGLAGVTLQGGKNGVPGTRYLPPAAIRNLYQAAMLLYKKLAADPTTGASRQTLSLPTYVSGSTPPGAIQITDNTLGYYEADYHDFYLVPNSSPVRDGNNNTVGYNVSSWTVRKAGRGHGDPNDGERNLFTITQAQINSPAFKDNLMKLMAELAPVAQFVMGNKYRFETLFSKEFAGWAEDSQKSDVYVDRYPFRSGWITAGTQSGSAWAPARNRVDAPSYVYPTANEWTSGDFGGRNVTIAIASFLARVGGDVNDRASVVGTSVGEVLSTNTALYQSKASWYWNWLVDTRAYTGKPTGAALAVGRGNRRKDKLTKRDVERWEGDRDNYTNQKAEELRQQQIQDETRAAEARAIEEQRRQEAAFRARQEEAEREEESRQRRQEENS